MTKDVLVYEKRNELFTTSDIIADSTNTSRKSVRSLIRKYKNELQEFGKLSDSQLAESTGGRRAEYYLLNEQQSTFLLTLLRNNEIVIKFKIALVKEFYRMKTFILERQSIEWQNARSQGKIARREETDVIQKLVEYAKNQGSSNYSKLYMTYSSLANKMLGISNRNLANLLQLTNLTIIERMILHCIQEGMNSDLHYKEIYQMCKHRLQQYLEITYFEEQRQIGQ